MEMFVIAAVVGVLIGLVSGLLGVGGGMIMVPVFRLAFGLSPVQSTATSLFAIIPTSISGVISHIRGKTCSPRIGIVLGIGGALTSPLGAWLANVSPGWLVMGITAITIAYSGFTMLQRALKVPAKPTVAKETKQPAIEMNPSTIAKAIGIGIVTGVVSGYIGLGGGFIMVPMMMSLFNMPMHLTSGTSLIGIMILAIPGTVLQCALGNVDYLVGIAICCGSIPGALVGARLVPRMPERTLRLAFAAFLGIAAILLIVKELGVLV